MSRRSSNQKFIRFVLILVTLLFVGVSLQLDVLVGIPSTSAQKKRTSSQRRKPAAEQQPTPTPSALDLLGEPPPMPTPTPTPTPPPEDITPGEVISVDTTEVMLPVTVRDTTGKLVNDLTRRDFRVYEDSGEQPLSDLALRQVPVDAVLMVDASSSVASNLDDFRRAAEGFAERLTNEDRISLIKFDDRVELLQDWTHSRFQLRRALTRIEPGIFTRFNDALLLAAKEQFGPSKSRRAVIVLTDGIDSGRSGTTLEGAVQSLLRAQVTVYVVSNTEIARSTKRAELDSLLGGSDSTVRFNQLRIDDLRMGLQILDESERRLEQIVTATGGRLYRPHSFSALDSVYAEVAEELRHQYALYYTPINRTRDGGFRRVRVEMTNSDFKATTRVGYFAPRS